MKVSAIFITLEYENDPSSISPPFGSSRCGNFINIKCTISEILRLYLKHFTCLKKKSESLQTEGHHFRSMICKFSDV